MKKPRHETDDNRSKRKSDQNKAPVETVRDNAGRIRINAPPKTAIERKRAVCAAERPISMA